MFFKVLINLLATQDSLSLYLEHISKSLFCNRNFIDLLWNLLPLSSHILFGFWLDSPKFLWKITLLLVIPFLSFKGTTHAYLLKISRTHSNRNPLLYLLVNCIWARSASQPLSLKDEYTFVNYISWFFFILCFLFSKWSTSTILKTKLSQNISGIYLCPKTWYFFVYFITLHTKGIILKEFDLKEFLILSCLIIQ